MKLSAHDIAHRLEVLPGWQSVESSLVREFTFGSFPDAIVFVARLAFDAEAADHHPDLTVSYKRVTVRWSTHDEGGVTERDFEGVRQTDSIAQQMTAASGQNRAG